MAINYEYSLTNSKGLGRVIYFYGLEFPIIICPTIHGEPLLTTQAFYYLEQLESVVRIRFEKPSNIPKHSTATDLERIFEYTIDNYLFEFSKKESLGTPFIYSHLRKRESLGSLGTPFIYSHLRKMEEMVTFMFLCNSHLVKGRNAQFHERSFWTPRRHVRKLQNSPVQL